MAIPEEARPCIPWNFLVSRRDPGDTDVNIAVEMVKDAALKDDFDLALLITADLDLRPAALAVANWEKRPNISVAVWFPPGNHSQHWESDNPHNFSFNTITRAMLEESRLREDIRSIHCPDEWRKPIKP